MWPRLIKLLSELWFMLLNELARRTFESRCRRVRSSFNKLPTFIRVKIRTRSAWETVIGCSSPSISLIWCSSMLDTGSTARSLARLLGTAVTMAIKHIETITTSLTSTILIILLIFFNFFLLFCFSFTSKHLNKKRKYELIFIVP